MIGISIPELQMRFVRVDKPLFSADLALADIWLPGLHGLDLVHRLRELAPDLPLVLITARPALETAVLALRLVEEQGFGFPVLLWEGAVAGAYRVPGLLSDQSVESGRQFPCRV